jgi:large subunit ribosomal protein L29
MAIGSKELAVPELETYDDERLVEELRKAKEELFNLRFQSATGQLESHGRLRAVKRDIARIYTIIRERELGLRATPIQVETPKAEKKTRAKKAAPAAEAEPGDTESADGEPAETAKTEEEAE